jgi:hypothetical protein
MSPLTLSTPCVLRRLLRQDYPSGATGSPLSRQKIRAVTACSPSTVEVGVDYRNDQ